MRTISVSKSSKENKKRANLNNVDRIAIVPYLFILPAAIALGATVFLPATGAFSLSFAEYNYDITQLPEWVGFDNFARLRSDREFWLSLQNTIIYLIGAVPVLVFVPLGLAVLVDRKLRGINWFRLLYYTPVLISMVVAAIAWKAIYASNGLLNQSLKQLGFDLVIPWLTSPKTAIWSVILVTIWKGLGYYMVIYLAGLQSIPQQLYEAAAIDGSDGWRKHIDITLPLMRPYLVLVGCLSAISATKVFEEVYVMTGGGPNNSSKTVVYYLWEQAFDRFDLNYACTIGLVLFLAILGLSILSLYVSRYTN